MSRLPPAAGGLRVIVTANTEYHLSSEVCIAVRDRRTGMWSPTHRALGEKVVGSFLMQPNLAIEFVPGAALVGHRLCFANDLLTSPVLNEVYPTVLAHESYWELKAA